MTTSRNVGRLLDEENLTEKENQIVEAATLPPEERSIEPSTPEGQGTAVMDRKRDPIRHRVQRTFRLYPELLEALSDASAMRKHEGFEQWSQDAIINHALSEWLRANGY